MKVKQFLNKLRWLILGDITAKETGRPYKNLASLIERSMSRLKINARCPYCGTEMMFRTSHLVGPGNQPARDDIGLKCPYCFHTAHFGVPITKKEYEEELRLRGGAYLLHPAYRLDERRREDVKRRLRALGYLEI